MLCSLGATHKLTTFHFVCACISKEMKVGRTTLWRYTQQASLEQKKFYSNVDIAMQVASWDLGWEQQLLHYKARLFPTTT